MVANDLLLIVLLLHLHLILVLTTNDSRGFPHPSCSPLVRFNPVYLPHPNDCRKFYECDLGLAYEFQCPSEMHFNVYINGCDTPENAFCRIDHCQIHQETRQKPKPEASELAVTIELKDMSTTKTSLGPHTLQTSQESNRANKITSTELHRLANISNHISRNTNILSHPNVATHSTRNSRKNYWSQSTEQANEKENTRNGTLVDKMFFSRSATKPSSSVQQSPNLIASNTGRPRDQTVSRTRWSTSTYKKNSLHLEHKNIALESERTTTSISRRYLKKGILFGAITNNGTIGENSVLNKL